MAQPRGHVRSDLVIAGLGSAGRDLVVEVAAGAVKCVQPDLEPLVASVGPEPEAADPDPGGDMAVANVRVAERDEGRFDAVTAVRALEAGVRVARLVATGLERSRVGRRHE